MSERKLHALVSCTCKQKLKISALSNSVSLGTLRMKPSYALEKPSAQLP